MFELWKKLHTAPHHLPMTEEIWNVSMDSDVDSDGRQLFTELDTEYTEHAMVQYGYSAFGFDENGEISKIYNEVYIKVSSLNADNYSFKVTCTFGEPAAE